MSRLLAIPKAIVGTLNNKAIQVQMRTTSWLVVGAFLYQLSTIVLPQRVAFLLTFTALSIQLVPTILVAAGLLPNESLKDVAPGKTAALLPNTNGSKGTPSGRGFALLIIGIRISHPLGLFAPGAKETGDYFTSLVALLESKKAELGYLGGNFIQSSDSSNSLSLIGYFDSMASLHNFAHGAEHRDAWNWWNKNVKSFPHLGVYHEAYDIPAHHWEAIYLQTPKMGLGATEVAVGEGEEKKLVSVLEDARKGIWRTSRGRMGRGEKGISETDPYVSE